MGRDVNDRTLLDLFVIDFTDIVKKYCKYAVVSGFVAISHGRTRGTEDIDIILEKISKDDFLKLHSNLVSAGFECVQSESSDVIYDTYLSKHDSVRYVKKGTFVPEMELKLAKDDLDNYQLKTRKKLPLTKLDIYFSSIEMNIAFKEELLKSDKDIEDARHLRIVYSEDLDEGEIIKIKNMIKMYRLT